jgi:dipeptidyl aminopeptidase/acylaminoacyl peptidase
MKLPLNPLAFALFCLRPFGVDAQVDYSRAEQMLSRNLERYVFGTDVTPQWLSDSTRFWYRVRTPRGGEYHLVDPIKSAKRPLFDNAKLAAAISAAIDSAVEPSKLTFTSIKFEGTGEQSITFTVGKRQLKCDIVGYRCTSGPIPEDKSATRVRSPDEKWDAIIVKYNLYLRPVAGGDSIQITTDGVFRFEYGSHADAGAMRPSVTPLVKWSHDSKYLLVERPDYREVKLLPLYSSTTTRPTYKLIPYAMPGDSVIPRAQIYVIDIATRTSIPVKDESGAPAWFGNHVVSGAKWTANSSRCYVTRAARDRSRATTYAIDPRSPTIRAILTDSSGTARGSVEFLKQSGDLIVPSWRDGWLNLYRYDAEGRFKNQITKGPFSVRDVLYVDEKAGTLYFTANVTETGRFQRDDYVYRINLDGTGLTMLTPESAAHSFVFAPHGEFFIDTYSTPTTAPVTVVRSVRDGKVTMTLERGDISRLATIHWRAPERFEAVAADGVTPVYGFLYLPRDFDSTKTYPVIDHIYPHGSVTAYRRSWGFLAASYGDPQALAELGFVVVQMDGRGTWTPFNRSDRDTYYRHMGQNSLPDHVTAIKQLGAKYRWMDLTRVGIYGHSGGGYASTAGMLRYPDFYKVAVSTAGNHDNRTYWWGFGEEYQGLVVRDTLTGKDNWEEEANATHAKNLKGKLLLMHGDMDDNVHPAHTLRLVHALIAANKKFDMLILPDRDHDLGEGYVTLRRWDYFVTHLLGKTPPETYQFTEIKP